MKSAAEKKLRSADSRAPHFSASVSDDPPYPSLSGSSDFLHTHSPAPFIDSWIPSARPGLNFTVYLVVRQTCGPLILTVEIDWSATVGRWVTRT